MKWLVSDLFINKLFRLAFEIFIFRYKRKSKSGFFNALVGKPSHKKGYKPLKHKPFTYQNHRLRATNHFATKFLSIEQILSINYHLTIYQQLYNQLTGHWQRITNPPATKPLTANNSFTNHCPPIYWLLIYQIWKQWSVDIMLFSLDLKLFIIISKWNEYLINFSSYLMILLHHLASFKIVNSSNVILK